MGRAVNYDSDVVLAQANGPPAIEQKSIFDCLLGNDDKADSTVTVSDEVDTYFEEQPISRKADPLFGAKAMLVHR